MENLNNIYLPSDDTFLLLDSVEELDGPLELAVEIGTGRGLIAIKLAEKGAYVIATDLDKNAAFVAKNNANKANVRERMDFIVGDLLSFFKNKVKITLIAFNPPYVPEENPLRNLSWYGGCNGRETIDRFLEQMRNVSSQIVLIVQSTLSKPEKTRSALRSMGYCVEVKRKTEFFEEIVLLKAIKSSYEC